MNDTYRDGYAVGYREGYERCRIEMTDECDRRIREVERGNGRSDAEHNKRETCRRVPYDPSLSPFELYVCDHCGHAIDAPDRFCGGCGRQVEVDA